MIRGRQTIGRSRHGLPTMIIVVALVLIGACGSGDSDPATAAAIDGAELFSDPQGSYTIEVDPDWQANHGSLAAEIEVWFVAEPSDEFAPNLNILTQLAPQMNLEEYLELSIDNGPIFFSDFELIEGGTVDGASGQPLATVEYTGDGLRFLAVFAVSDGEAVVATLSAPIERFGSLRDEVLPHLLTLER